MENRENWILPLISLILLGILVLIIMIIITPQLSPGSSKLPCPKNYCVSNIYDGIKTCPEPGGSVEYDPSYEVCNPSGGCLASSKAPCVYYNPEIGSICPGDSRYTGVCPNAEDCKCLQSWYCPDFAQVYFEQLTVSNAGLSDPSGYRVFVQNTIWNSPANAPRSDLPISLGLYNSIGYRTCGISGANSDLIWPQGTCIRGSLGFNLEDNLWYCMPDQGCAQYQHVVRNLDGTFTCSI